MSVAMLMTMSNAGSGNGLVPDGTKPLPEPPMLTNISDTLLHQYGGMS